MKKYIAFLLLTAVFPTVTCGRLSADDRTFSIGKNLTIFNAVFRDLDLLYVDSLKYDKMTADAINYMLSQTDPYTVYLPEEDTEDIAMMTSGEYGGIGSVISQRNNTIYISDPYEGMPAQQNDIRAGDIISAIDGVSTEGMTVSDVSARLRGTPNTVINLQLKRYGEENPIERTFMREKIQVKSISYSSVVADRTGYLLLNDFTDHSAIEVKQAINEMVKQHRIRSLIIDVRGNGGGLIDEAVKIVGYFVPKGTAIVTTKGKEKSSERVFRTPSEPVYPDMKLAVITDRGSASASEILAGAIQDLDRGVIVGERTFGKGLVQNIRPIAYGGHLKVTTAKYYIPSGRGIQAIDYSNRNEDGSVGRVPEHLTSEFTTKNGRKVRNGGGILPDTLSNDERTLNIAYYLYADNLYFDYATKYKHEHPSIPSPDLFELSDADFDDFTAFIKEKNFGYATQTEKYFNELIEIAKYEELYNRIAEDFESLKAKLVPDIDENIKENKDDIVQLLTTEIIKRYYYQKGEIAYSLRTDKDLKIALDILHSEEKYNRILSNE
jgi:carboxyl-terminal processing protease